MKVATQLSYSGGFKHAARQVVEMEAAGLDLVWVAEAYGFDSPSLMGYLAALTERVEIGSAILPIYTRTPTLLAMTAAGIDALSDGRFHLGLGASGPQVIEGFHGVAYTAPLGPHARDHRDLPRRVAPRGPARAPRPLLRPPARERRGHGPRQGAQDHRAPRAPLDPRVGGVARRAQRRDDRRGRRRVDPDPVHPRARRATSGARALAEGAAKRDASLGPLQVTAGGLLAIGDGDEVTALRELARPGVALYVGGMGAKGKNFYNELACRYGFEKEAAAIQDLYLAGKKKEAEALVPDELLELTSLCGPEGYVKERVAAFREAGVTHLQVSPIPRGEQRAADLIELVKGFAS